MKKYILPALIANAATLGVHWIYDYEYLEALAKKQSLLFLSQTKEIYDQAKVSFFSYPNNAIGDVTVQGEILKWLYLAMKDNPDFNKEDYSKLLYNQFKPGGDYVGYVESYSKKHVISVLAKSLNIDLPEMPVNDNHLVGFIPYLVCKELGEDNKKAWELTNVYSQDKDYYNFFIMFDRLIELLPQVGMKEGLRSVIYLAPEQYQTALNKAIELDNSNEFIEKYAGRACAIKHSIPVIFHILAKTSSYQEAIETNALIGGAVADRSTILGAIYAQISKVPDSWAERVDLKFKP